MVKPLKKALGGFTHLLVAVDKFTKWIEGKPITNIRSEEVTVIWGLTTFGVKMAQINNTKKPPQFDGTNYPYWKSHIKSINRNVWKVVETKIEIEDLENPTVAEEVLLQNNDIALSAIHDAIDERTFEQIKNIEMAHEP